MVTNIHKTCKNKSKVIGCLKKELFITVILDNTYNRYTNIRYIINGSVGRSVENPLLKVTSVDNGIKINKRKKIFLKLTKV